jgi:hypothetical protein
MLACREQRSEDFTALAELRRTGAMPIAAGLAGACIIAGLP